jgi:hypothetical protein
MFRKQINDKHVAYLPRMTVPTNRLRVTLVNVVNL